VGLNGFPIPDEKPQAAAESDAEPEETFIDAFSHTLTHQVTDIHIPMEGSDLALTVRRNWSPEIWNLASGLKPTNNGYYNEARPDRPFGAGWRSNISANIQFATAFSPTTYPLEFAYVTDENGTTYRFLVLPYVSDGSGGYVKRFLPLPENKHQQEVIATKLEETASGHYRFTRKMGTELNFITTGRVLTIFDVNDDGQQLNSGSHYSWARLTTAKDRFGSAMSYGFTDVAGQPLSLLPTKISFRGKSINITYNSDGQVSEIEDPRGVKKIYTYATTTISLIGFSQSLPCLASVATPNAGITNYTYSGVEEIDPTPRESEINPAFNHFFFVDLESISDPNDNTTSFSYAFDHSRKSYMHTGFFTGWFAPSGNPRNVTSTSRPGGAVATFSNLSNVQLDISSGLYGGQPQPSGQKKMAVTDAKGETWAYDFTEGEAIRLEDFKNFGSFDGNTNMPMIILYKTMTVSTPGGGTMVAEFDKTAGMALKSFKDVGALVATTFEYENGIDFSIVQPWMWESLSTALIAKYPMQKWGDVTKQTNPLGKVKTFEYDSKWRVMKKITDEKGRITEYGINSANGNRLNETIASIQRTDFDYGNTSFPGIVTAKVVQNQSGTLPWPVDLRTEYELDPTTGNILKEKVGATGSQRVTEYTYDANNNKTSTKDPNGNITTFVYDALNRLTEVDPPGQGKKVITYDSRGNKIAEEDENTHKTLREYDGLNRVVKEARDMNGNGLIDSADLVTETTYNGLNAKLTVKSPTGHTTTMEYDGLNRLVKTTDPLANVTTFAYGANSGGLQFGREFKPTQVVNPRGFQTLTEYDALFRPTSRKVEYKKDAQNNPVFAVSTFEYDDVGNVTKETDPLNHATTHTYDALNRRTSTLWPDLTTTQTFYTSTGLKWRTVDELGRDTLTEYDDAGRPVKVSSPEVDNGYGGNARSVTQTAYDAAGNVISTTNPRGSVWTFAYDARNRKITEIRPGAGSPTLHWAYDAAGNVVKTTDARGNATDTTYDVANRVVKVEEPSVPVSGGGSARPTTEKGYDKNSNVTSLTDPNGHVTINTYDAMNRLLKTTDAEGIVVTNEYDAVGNRVAVIDGKLQRTGFAYDGLNRNTQITDALNKSTTFEFDGVNKTARVDAIGQRTEYGYDLRNRLLAVNYAGRTQDNRALAYDATGNLLAVVEATPSKSVAYSYDALKRQLTETSGGLTHNYHYDLAGNRIFCLYGGLSVPLVSAYDEQNRLSTLTQGTLVTTYAYDANGNVITKTLPNGDTAMSVFDAANRTTSLTGTSGLNTPLYAYGYEYDAGANVKKVTETYATTTMNRVVANDYDADNRLLTEAVTGSGAATTTFGYDDAHNRETMSKGGVNSAYTYNANNQLTGFTEGSRTVGFGYDDNGNRVTRTEGATVDAFSWDYENRLVGLTKQSTGGIGAYAWAYDYRTRRVSLTTPTAPLTQVAFSGGTSVREIENGVPTVDYVRGSDWGGGVGGILYSLRAGVPSFTHYNRRGDVTAKTDGTGAITYQAEYEAFGKRTSETGATADRQKSNTKDEDIPGYANEGFRFRDLETGSFPCKDPLGYTLMQPADKWFVDGNAVTAREYAEATLPGLVKDANPDLTKTAKEANAQAQYESYVKSERTVPGEKSHWHIAEPGQPNIYAYCLDNPWSKFDPEGLSDIYLNRDFPTGKDKEQRRSPGDISIVEGSKNIYEGRANVNGFMKDPKTSELTRGVPKGEYTVQPKVTDGTRFPAGTPAITGEGQPAGKPADDYKADAVLFHAKNPDGSPDSLSCVTLDPKGAKLVKDVMDRDIKKGETTRFHVTHKTEDKKKK